MRSPIRGVPADVEERYNLPGENRNAANGPRVPVTVTVQRSPPEIFPIPDARGFTLFDTADLTGVNSTATPAGLTLQLTDGYSAVIRAVSLDLNDVSATTDVRYAIRVGGAAVIGYDVLRHFPRVAASVSKDFDAFIVVPDGRKVDMIFTNVDGGAHKMGAQLVGWQWPTASGKRWMGDA